MNKKGPSNVFDLPKWMSNLRAREPEGTRTPDQVASSLELSNLIHGPSVERLESIVLAAIPTVPLKRQPYLRALLQGDVVANCQAFIDLVNTQLAFIPKEEPIHAEPAKEELPAGGLDVEPGGESVVHSDGSDWGGDWDSPCQPRPSSRGLRALRSAKRGQTDL